MVGTAATNCKGWGVVNRLRIAIVGLGTIAQTLHLPNLVRMWDRFEIVCVCSLDAAITTHVALGLEDRVRVSLDSRPIFDDADLDAVLHSAVGADAVCPMMARQGRFGRRTSGLSRTRPSGIDAPEFPTWTWAKWS